LASVQVGLLYTAESEVETMKHQKSTLRECITVESRERLAASSLLYFAISKDKDLRRTIPSGNPFVSAV
jgi:hypothetical protein